MIGIVQRALRAGFMGVEAVFNRAFGDRMNPFYHLGKISFFLFWIIGATGLILYAFFDTSVEGAFQSVETITHSLWGLGGVLRSLHRYASDAMVLTMLLHMLRYFAFDRLRGFRAFSWVTGVALIWLVYAAGANGYMLPWDQLAQFVTTTSFEWLDWIPLFRGSLIRNFIYDSTVSDRLFSLLVFIHIGVPLLTLLLMWVHVQRVPKAAMQPPKPIAVSAGVMLLVLALVLPVVSQGGPAHMAVVPSQLKLDWLLLGLYPLVHAWGPAWTWALVLGVTGLLLVQPWLVWRRAGGAARTLNVTVHPDARHVSARRGETILEAGLRAELPLQYDCRAGGCGLCVCTVLNGKFDHGPYQPATLTEAMRERGQALMCCAVPLEDLEIEVETLEPLIKQEFSATVVSMERLAPEVMRLLLQPPADLKLDFIAGQYLNVILEDGERRAFSFANPPMQRPLIDLHVRRIPGGRFTGHVFDGMQVGDTLRLEGPLGRFTLREGERPIVFLAGATGFAPVKSIIEDAFARGITRPMRLYLGVRQVSDLYMRDLAETWQCEHANFRFIPVLSDGAPGDGWEGRRGLVHQAVLEDFPDMRGQELYACGSTMMVQTAVPAFLSHGLEEGACFSDAFVLNAPRAAAAESTS